MKASWAWVALSPFFLAASFPTHASSFEKYEIREAQVTPEVPRVAEGTAGAKVTVQVRVKVMGRFTGDVPTCEAAIDFGDGSPVEASVFGKLGGTSNVNNVAHVYAKPGNYTVKVSGTRSTLACAGKATTSVTVLGANDPSPLSSSQAGVNGQRVAAGVAGTAAPRKSIDAEFELDDIKIEAGRSPCPPGWEIIPKSDNAPYRFACRMAAVKPLSCQGGTSYYENAGTIGCR